jgi:hypothetical protein
MSGPDAPGHQRSRWVWMLTVLASGVLLTFGCALPGGTVRGMDHQVVGDPLDATGGAFERASMTRSFQATDTGGVEQVVVHDPADAAQLARVRTYLQQEAARFQEGRYEDPAKTHGMEMPGSKELEGGYSRVQVRYADLPNGGQVTHIAPDQALIQALHAWFERRQIGA